MTYDPTYAWGILETDIILPNNNEHDLYLKVPIDGVATTSEVLVSETHIDPLRDDGYMIYKLGAIKAVVDGRREAAMLWGNARGQVSEIVESEINDITSNLYQSLSQVINNHTGTAHETYLIDNTANASETVVSGWAVIPYAEQVGEFKAVVMVRNKATNTIITLIALLSFDYSEAPNVVLQSNLTAS